MGSHLGELLPSLWTILSAYLMGMVLDIVVEVRRGQWGADVVLEDRSIDSLLAGHSRNIQTLVPCRTELVDDYQSFTEVIHKVF